MFKKVLLPGLCMLFLFVATVMLFGGGDQKEVKGGGTLVYGKSHAAIALDPAVVDEGGSSMVVEQIFESLLTYKPGTTELVPSLAERYELSEDGKEIVFYLRKGVKFHDGTQMDADAVVFSLARQHYKDHPFHNFGPWKHWDSKAWGDHYNEDGSLKKRGLIKDIEKIDDYTLRVTLNEPDASILINFASYWTAAVSPTAVREYGETFRKNPVGTGPFKFVEWLKDDHVTVERFDDYWDEPAKVERAVFKVYPDESARTMALLQGEVDIIDPPDYDNLLQIMDDSNIKVEFKEGLSVGYVCMNVERPPFDNKLVRQAVNYAINKEEIIEGVYGVLGSPGNLPLPKNLWGHNEKIKPYAYNSKKAKELLVKAGYPDGFSIKLFALPVSRPYNPNGRKVGEIMQAQLAKIGIKAELVTYDIGTYWDKVDAGEFDMAMTGWTGSPDPDDFLFNLFTSGYLNSSRWYNDEYIDLVTSAKHTPDQEDRAELYKKALAIMHEEAPIVMLAHGTLANPMRKHVKGFVMYPGGDIVLKPVSIAD